jgi:phosphate transport system substrate-binding protein
MSDRAGMGHDYLGRDKPMIRRPHLFVVAALALAFAGPSANAADMTLNETGSSLLYPLFQLWIPDYTAANPGLAIVAAATGSGAGIEQTINGRVQIGASDAYMSDQQAQHDPDIINIPLAISAQTVNYNVPGLSGAGLKLDGPVLAEIYAGKIATWDASQIAALNPGVALPHQTIIPIRRGDSSGDTFVFTQFLDFSTQTWEDTIGYGTEVRWPVVAGAQTAQGNDGMVKAIAETPYSVGYIGISLHEDIAKAAIGTALIKNQAGKFLLPTAETVSAAASELDPRTPPDERLSLAYAPGDGSYPLINYEYAVVSIRQPDPATAAAIRRFLLWSVSLQGGNAPTYLNAVQFIPLPDFIRALSENQINRVQVGTE